MCTVVVLRRPDHRWPVIVAANRDEMADRPWRGPARHWPARPAVMGGLDVLAGGTWLGVNDRGVIAAVLIRVGSLGPSPDKRSRGELPLAALDHGSAAAAAATLAGLDARDYRPFNMLIVDAKDGVWLRNSGHHGVGAVDVVPLETGLSMLTAYDLNDPASPRIRRFRQRFEAAAVPDPDAGDWAPWEALLAATDGDPDAGPGGAMTVVTDSGFGTVCSSVLALPQHRADVPQPVWRFAPGRPDEASFTPVRLDALRRY